MKMMTRIIVVGGGFAGINLIKGLAGKKGIEVVLVDKNNYHFFPPLLYQVATAFIEPSNITYPFRKMFQGKQNVRFYNGTLLSVDDHEKQIITDSGRLNYDFLVLAMGTETNFYGLETLKTKALPIKTIEDALYLRNHLLMNMEKAVKTINPQERTKLLNLVIAGGGPTGVELAGMAGEMSKSIFRKDYPELDEAAGNIYLVGSGDKLLGPMSKKAQQESYKQLSKLGVQIKLGVAVQDYMNDEVILSNGEKISTCSLIWASGVVAVNVNGLPDESSGRGGRLKVDAYNSISGINSIFAIGDICCQTTDKHYPEGHPQLAQVAIQQGELLAANLVNLTDNKRMKPFTYVNKGSMAIITKYHAVVDLPFGSFKGYFAWLTWLFVHIIPIAGFRNKAKLAYNWIWSFLTNDPNLRLIIRAKKDL